MPCRRKTNTMRTRIAPALLAIAGWCCACSSDEPPPPRTEIICAEGGGGQLAAGGTVEITSASAESLTGAAVTAPMGVDPFDLKISCDKRDLVPAGKLALGPTVSFAPLRRRTIHG